jgi:hypothetical protein
MRRNAAALSDRNNSNSATALSDVAAGSLASDPTNIVPIAKRRKTTTASCKKNLVPNDQIINENAASISLNTTMFRATHSQAQSSVLSVDFAAYSTAGDSAAPLGLSEARNFHEDDIDKTDSETEEAEEAEDAEEAETDDDEMAEYFSSVAVHAAIAQSIISGAPDSFSTFSSSPPSLPSPTSSSSPSSSSFFSPNESMFIFSAF